MRRLFDYTALAVFLCAFMPGAAAASDMTVVVERGESTVEVYVGLPADGLVEVFALPPSRLEDETGKVAFEPLRLGTWLIGDDVISSTDTRVGGEPMVYEAMSLMVHPEDQRLPLYDAYDGAMAIAVCSVEPPANPTLATLYSYVGFIAYPDDPNADLSFTLPLTGRDAIEVELRDFRAGELISETAMTLPDGGTIEIAAAPLDRPWISLQAVGAALFLSLMAFAVFFLVRGGIPKPRRSV